MATLHSSFKPDKVDFLEIAVSKMGMHTVPLGYAGSKAKPTIQTPKMRLPFGFGSGMYPDSKSLRIAFLVNDTAFEKALVGLDARIESFCEASIKDLFPNVKDAANKCTYQPIVEEHAKHTSKIRTKLSTKGTDIVTAITDEAGNPLTVEALKPGTQVTAILRFSYVWAAGQTKSYGVTPYVEMLRVHGGEGPVGFVDDPADKATATEHDDGDEAGDEMEEL